MANENWDKAKKIFGDAIKVAPDERASFLDKVCDDDKTVRREVESLLASYDDAESFMESPAVGEVAEVIRQDKNLERGKCFGHYEIIKQLGAGGMGEVYLAEDTRLNRRVALKLLPTSLSSDENANRRLLREARAAATLDHPHICQIHEIAETGGRSFIVMQYIVGETLAAKLKKGNLNLGETLDLAIHITDALADAHSHQIIHRDIKPANIIVNEQGQAKILDFGLAKIIADKLKPESEAETAQMLSAANMIIGTVPYMSPEQVRGKPLDARTDIFSFGVALYEMLSGKQLFSRESQAETISAILRDEPFFREIPELLQPIVQKCLIKNRDERYQTAKDLLFDLKALQKRLEFEAEFGVPPLGGFKPGEAETQILEARTTAEEMPPKGGTPNANSIAVLPFTNMSADAENEYFCDGLAEELLNALAKIEDLKVAARTSAFSFKGKNTNVSEIGEKLSVKTVMEGSVRRSGNKLRISVQLVNASDGFHLWSERYDREMRDIFDVQDEITLAVVDALKLKLFGGERAAVLKRGTENQEAYELYLKGRFFFNKFTKTGNEKAIEFYEQALAKEPNYAHVFAALSSSYNYSWYLGFGETAKCISEAKAAVNKALALDQSLAEAHFALALIKFNYEWDWTEAEKAFQRAIELNPNYAESHEHYGMFLAVMERSDEAVAEAKRAIEIAPLALKTIYIAGWAFWLAGHARLAKEQGEKLLEMEPNFSGGHTHLGVSLWGGREYEKSLNELETDVKLGGGNDIRMLLGLLYGMVGKREKANHLLTEFERLDEQGIFTANQQAFICAGLGEMDRAFVLLEQAFARHEGVLVFLKQFSSLFPKLHNDSRMTDLLNRIGLPTDKTNQTDESLEAKTVMLSTGEVISELRAKDSETKTAETKPTSEPASNPKSKIQNPKSKWWLFGLLGLVLIVGGFFGYKYFSPTNKQIESIAVLPFENESGSADTEYLSDGMTETLIRTLSQLPKLNVKARSSVFRYKGKEIALPKIGQELNVQAILTGRVVQRGQDLTLYIELVDAATENSLWKADYNRPMTNLVALQSDVARDVSNQLQLKLSGADKRTLTKNYTENAEAYKLYLQGRFFWNKRTPKDVQKAVEYFQQAIAVDPNYALGFAGLADASSLLSNLVNTPPPREAMPKAKDAALKALSLDENLAEAHTALALIMINYDYDFAGAERELKRSLELNPSYMTAHLYYAQLLFVVGRHEESLAAFRRALEIEPFSMPLNRFYGISLIYARRYDDGIAQMKRTLELDGNSSLSFNGLAQAYEARGRYGESVEAYAKSYELLGRTETAALIRESYARSGWQGFLREMTGTRRPADLRSYIAAAYHAALGEKDKAFAELEKTYENREFYLVLLKVDPRFDPLRDDPRFQDLLRRVGFPE